MRTLIIPVFFLSALCSSAQEVSTVASPVKVFSGAEVLENAFLIEGKKKFVLIDALGSSVAAQQIVQFLKGKKLETIFITHAHPDHFLGMSTILKAHPQATVYVGSEDIRQDIISYMKLVISKRAIDQKSSMKPNAEFDDDFNYEKIQVLSDNRLDIGDGNYLTVENFKDPTESAHTSILYTEKSDVLFASDLLYNKVFNWLGPGADQRSIENWISKLTDLKNRFDSKDIIIFPGHGQRSDHSIFDQNIHYLQSFLEILARTTSQADATVFFKKLYPEYQGEFLLSRSISHWYESSMDKKDFISINHIQDLTHTLTDKFPFIPVPGVTFPFELIPIAAMEKHGVRANKWIIHEHIGTQIDAPNHFAPDGIALEALDVKDLIVPVIVIDISEKSSTNADATLTVDDIRKWEATNGRVPYNACVMMYSGWEKFLYEDKYIGLDQSHTKHFPGISLEAMQFLLSERNISGVGVDVISFDPGYDNEYKGHKLLLGAGKWGLEAVANLKLIPANGAHLFVGAPKVKGATGGIVRLLAVWP
jgi:kynurenine formamidase/glyoxylase-like metal-dependent hydrolase (beta-lactamase superfamily II)